MYSAVRSMAGISQDVIIVTSSLTKDMTGKVSLMCMLMVIKIVHPNGNCMDL